MLPEGIDRQTKNWKRFVQQCSMYVRANQDAFRTDEDQIFFMLSHMNKGLAAEMARLYIADSEHQIDGKMAAEFLKCGDEQDKL